MLVNELEVNLKAENIRTKAETTLDIVISVYAMMIAQRGTIAVMLKYF